MDVHEGALVSLDRERGGVRVSDETELGYDVISFDIGRAAPPLVAELGLGDEHGIPVRDTLQHLQHDEIYGAGDRAHFVSRPLPRISVHGMWRGG